MIRLLSRPLDSDDAKAAAQLIMTGVLLILVSVFVVVMMGEYVRAGGDCV